MRCCFFFLPVLLCACMLAAGAQAPMAAPNLKDADALFAAAAESNGLYGDDLKPWHVKANYDILDHTNKVIATGVFEEWWAAKDKWKRSFTGTHYTGTEWHLPEGNAHVGDGWTARPWPESLIVTRLLYPMHTETSLPPKHLKIHKSNFGRLQLNCLQSEHLRGSRFQNDPAGYCLESGSTTLRFTGFTGLETTYNKLGIFQGRTIGLDTSVRVNDHALSDIHVLSLGAMSPAEDAAFTPAIPITPRKDSDPVDLTASMIEGQKLFGNDFRYPVEAKRNEDYGLVIVGAVINKQGKVEDATVLESPSLSLGNAVLVAVRTWNYQPSLLAGKPVNLNTTFYVFYNDSKR